MLIMTLVVGCAATFLAVSAFHTNLRHALLLTAVFCGYFIAISSEGLSLIKLLTRDGIAIVWILLSVCILAILRKRLLSRSVTPRFASTTKVERLFGFGLILIFAVIGLTALLSPPNTWDAMEYHMPRIVMWASNHSLALFPTPNYAQVIFAPWAETAMLHLYLLWGNDRLVNLVDFFSFVGLSVAASAIAGLLGGSRLAQLCAAVIAGTIPSGLLEASGAMNTAVGAFWVTVAAYFTLSWNKEQSRSNLFGLSGALGLALLTKGSAYVFAPSILLASWWLGDYKSRIKLFQQIPFATMVVLLINVGQFYRLVLLTGSPLGFPFPDGGPQLAWTTGHFSFAGGIANVFRQLSLHLPTPYLFGLNDFVLKTVEFIVRLLGQDISDPAYIWPGGHFKINAPHFHEIYGGNPLHLALVVVALGLLVSKKIATQIRVFTVGIVLAFITFSFLLRWQEWGGRHHLVIFVLMAPVIAIAMESVVSRKALLAVTAILLIAATPYSLLNSRRRLLPVGDIKSVFELSRDELYFGDSHFEDAAATIAAAAKVRATNCNNISIDSYVPIPDREIVHSPPAFYVYPLMALSSPQAGAKHFQFISVQNQTKRFRPGSEGPPCVVVCLDCKGITEKTEPYTQYDPSVFGNTIVFVRKGQK
jgi:hypothetical protein